MKILLLVALFIPSATWANAPCGLTGTVEERIQDCNETLRSGEFQLVARTSKGQEIYKGIRTGVIWSADLEKPLNYLKDGVQTICSKDRPEFAGLKLNWKLPPVQRYIQALKYNIQSELPGISERIYWTSTSDSFYVNSRYIFEGDKAYTQNWNGKYKFRHLEVEVGKAYVKCIVETQM